MGLKINRNELNIEHALGAGGEGTVYDLPKDYSIRGLQGPFVYKEYLDFVKQDGKAIAVQIALDYMVNAYERLSRDEKAYIDQRAAWPLATVVDQDGATGLLMRKVIVRMVDPTAPDSNNKLFPLDRWIQTEKRIRKLGPKQGFKPMTSLGKNGIYNVYSHILCASTV